MKHAPWLIGFLMLGAFGSAQAAGVASTFDTNSDGWFVSDYLGNGSAAVAWSAGTIGTNDQFGETSFHAPEKFNGDKSSFYGSSLSFDLEEATKDSGANAYYTLIIASGADVLYWYGGAPLPTFTSFSALLSSTDTRWRLGGTGFNPGSGVAPTAAQFQSILANVTRLQINGEFTTGPDNTHLDNVILGAVPEPQTYMMMALGLGVLTMVKRRVKQA